MKLTTDERIEKYNVDLGKLQVNDFNIVESGSIQNGDFYWSPIIYKNFLPVKAAYIGDPVHNWALVVRPC